MSIIDIILVTAGVAVVAIYGFLAIKRTKAWQTRFKQLIKEGKTQEQAKLIADKEFYAKKNKNKNPNKEVEDDIFEE